MTIYNFREVFENIFELAEVSKLSETSVQTLRDRLWRRHMIPDDDYKKLGKRKPTLLHSQSIPIILDPHELELFKKNLELERGKKEKGVEKTDYE